MGLTEFWRSYKVLIVMGTGLGLIHLGWYHLKTNPLLRKTRTDYNPEEPGIVAFVSAPNATAKSKSWDEVSELDQEELVVGGGRSFPQHPRRHLADAEGDEELGALGGGAETEKCRGQSGLMESVLDQVSL
ncbi:hypothetical protein PHYPO_G00155010 [Xyrichtys novacula]|uniref:Uncharacterized protein n=1 Tax=Xyrichtys novacula TaxID=13765 RepID=A0AAV1EZH7_XYRNO|nr:hypothetical protein PHYPO_G00155010 [Xyrichtys novacula]